MRIIGLFLGIICLLYYLLVFNLAQSWIWLLLGLGFLIVSIFYKEIKKKVPDKPRYLAIGVMLCGFVFFSMMVGRVTINIKGNEKDNLEYIIVLGAKTNSPIMKARCDKAIEYLEDNKNTIVVVSGGQGRDEPMSEALAMKNYIIDNWDGENKENRILMEDKSTSTEENLFWSLELLESKGISVRNAKIGVVSSDFHLKRARYLLHTLGVKHINCLSVKTNPIYLPHYVLRESLALSFKFLIKQN